jgi:hypothetical protein
VRSASSHRHRSKTAKRAGRHRAPSRVPGNVKIIGAAVPVIALLGSFVAYEVQPTGPESVSGNVAAYHLNTVAPAGISPEGSGRPISGRSASLDKSSKTAKGEKRGKNDKTRTARAQPAKARSAPSRRPTAPATGSPTPSPKPSPSPSPSPSSSASLKAAVQQDIASGNYLLAVGQYLVENGYSDAAAAGVASCVDGESGGNPESVGTGGGGLIGWTPISSAEPNPNIITGDAAQDMMAQLSDLLYYNSTEIGQSLVDQLDAISDPVAAADFYSQNFEKPAITDSDVVPSVAEQIFSELSS